MNTPLHAGMLTERIVFEREVETADGLGGFASGWEDFATHWAYVTVIGGAPVNEGGAERARITRRVIIRRDDTLDISMRCVLDTLIHRIEWVAVFTGDHRFTECRISGTGETV